MSEYSKKSKQINTTIDKKVDCFHVSIVFLRGGIYSMEKMAGCKNLHKQTPYWNNGHYGHLCRKAFGYRKIFFQDFSGVVKNCGVWKPHNKVSKVSQ